VLQHLTRLEYLHLGFCPGFTVEEAKNLKGLACLQHLNIIDNSLGTLGLQHVVKGCPNLTSLNMSGLKDMGVGLDLAPLSVLTRLKNLIISRVNTPSDGLGVLTTLRSLEELDISSTSLRVIEPHVQNWRLTRLASWEPPEFGAFRYPGLWVQTKRV